MKDVARRARVSLTTVSLVLAGKAGTSIPGTTQRRVLDAAKELGYRRNALAAGLRSRGTNSIGFVSDHVLTTPHAAQMVQGAQDAAWKAGKVLLLGSTQGERELEQRVLDEFLARRVDGVLLAAMHHQVVEPPPELYETHAVLVDASSNDHGLSSVVPDESGGAFDATAHLIALGHRRIGYAQSTFDGLAARGRLEGYRRALEVGGLHFDPSLVVVGSEALGTPAGLVDMLRHRDRPTAMFCFNDRMAAGVVKLARNLGLEIPRDLSVIGFDNEEFVAEFVDPPLTSAQLPHYEMGKWAVEQLLTSIDDPGTPPVQFVMGCPIVHRDSVAPPGCTRGPNTVNATN